MNKRSGKKAFVWILALCMIFSTVGVASAVTFSDIKDHWAEDTITDWIDQDLVFGYQDGTFRPDAMVSRQEFTALVNRSFGFVEPGVIQFTDVSKTGWAYLDISKGVQAEYIVGYSDGTFKPMKEVNRQEVAVIIARLLDLKSSNSADLYTDTNRSP